MSRMNAELLEAAGEAEHDARTQRPRKRLCIALGATVALGAAAWGIHELVLGARFVSTDNAYTAAEIAQVTPAVGGIVRAVHVTDTEAVRAGDVLVRIDDTDARLALEQ